MVAGATDHCEQLRIVDGSTPEDVTWARALVSRQWRRGGAPGHGGWGRWLARRTPEATFCKFCGFCGEVLERLIAFAIGSFTVLVCPSQIGRTTVLEQPRAPQAFLTSP